MRFFWPSLALLAAVALIAVAVRSSRQDGWRPIAAADEELDSLRSELDGLKVSLLDSRDAIVRLERQREQLRRDQEASAVALAQAAAFRRKADAFMSKYQRWYELWQAKSPPSWAPLPQSFSMEP